jgi:short-subunit dehydrogenase
MADHRIPLVSESTALITGASSGIGYALALEFGRRGHPLVLVARNQEKLVELALDVRERYGVTAHVLVQDLARESAARDIYERVQEMGVQIDILVNNAGLIVYGNFHENEWEQERQMIQVNLLAVTALTKRFLRDMVSRGYGRILNVGSNGSFAPSPLNAVYSATKAYVLSFSEAIAEELVGSGVTVTALLPGATRTELQKRADMADVRLLQSGVMEPGDVARAGYEALMGGRRIALPGTAVWLQMFATRLLPRRTVVRMTKSLLQRNS